jgi:hypothetical protein
MALPAPRPFRPNVFDVVPPRWYGDGMTTNAGPKPGPGAVISGTMRPQDMVAAAFYEADFYVHDRAHEIADSDPLALAWALAAANKTPHGARHYRTVERIHDLYEKLVDALDGYGAQFGLEYGPNEHDPACHGWWEWEPEEDDEPGAHYERYQLDGPGGLLDEMRQAERILGTW